MNTLRMAFFIMIVFSAFNLYDGKPKGFYTRTFDYGCLIVGGIGQAVLGIMEFRKKKLRKKDDMDHHSHDK